MPISRGTLARMGNEWSSRLRREREQDPPPGAESLCSDCRTYLHPSLHVKVVRDGLIVARLCKGCAGKRLEAEGRS
jgi:hypothetical protein